MDNTQLLDCTQALPCDLDDDEEEDKQYLVAWLEIDGNRHEVFSGRNVIGRDPDECRIVIPNKVLSKQHAVVEVRAGVHTVADLGSSNKTRLGKMVLRPNVQYALQGGEKIRFGNVIAIYTIKPELCDDSGSETDSESMLPMIGFEKDTSTSPVLSSIPEYSVTPNAIDNGINGEVSGQLTSVSSHNCSTPQNKGMPSSLSINTPIPLLTDSILQPSDVDTSVVSATQSPSEAIQYSPSEDDMEEYNSDASTNMKENTAQSCSNTLLSKNEEQPLSTAFLPEKPCFLHNTKIACTEAYSFHDTSIPETPLPALPVTSKADLQLHSLTHTSSPEAQIPSSSKRSFPSTSLPTPITTLCTPTTVQKPIYSNIGSDSDHLLFKKPLAVASTYQKTPPIITYSSNYSKISKVNTVSTRLFVSNNSDVIDHESPKQENINDESIDLDTPTQTFLNSSPNDVDLDAATQVFTNIDTSTHVFIDGKNTDINTPTQAFTCNTNIDLDAPTQVFTDDNVDLDPPTQIFGDDNYIDRDAPTQVFTDEKNIDIDAPTQTFSCNTSIDLNAPTQLFTDDTTIDRDSPTRALYNEGKPMNSSQMSNNSHASKTVGLNTSAQVVLNIDGPTQVFTTDASDDIDPDAPTQVFDSNNACDLEVGDTNNKDPNCPDYIDPNAPTQIFTLNDENLIVNSVTLNTDSEPCDGNHNELGDGSMSVLEKSAHLYEQNKSVSSPVLQNDSLYADTPTQIFSGTSSIAPGGPGSSPSIIKIWGQLESVDSLSTNVTCGGNRNEKNIEDSHSVSHTSKTLSSEKNEVDSSNDQVEICLPNNKQDDQKQLKEEDYSLEKSTDKEDNITVGVSQNSPRAFRKLLPSQNEEDYYSDKNTILEEDTLINTVLISRTSVKSLPLLHKDPINEKVVSDIPKEKNKTRHFGETCNGSKEECAHSSVESRRPHNEKTEKTQSKPSDIQSSPNTIPINLSLPDWGFDMSEESSEDFHFTATKKTESERPDWLSDSDSEENVHSQSQKLFDLSSDTEGDGMQSLDNAQMSPITIKYIRSGSCQDTNLQNSRKKFRGASRNSISSSSSSGIIKASKDNATMFIPHTSQNQASNSIPASTFITAATTSPINIQTSVQTSTSIPKLSPTSSIKRMTRRSSATTIIPFLSSISMNKRDILSDSGNTTANTFNTSTSLTTDTSVITAGKTSNNPNTLSTFNVITTTSAPVSDVTTVFTTITTASYTDASSVTTTTSNAITSTPNITTNSTSIDGTVVATTSTLDTITLTPKSDTNAVATFSPSEEVQTKRITRSQRVASPSVGNIFPIKTETMNESRVSPQPSTSASVVTNNTTANTKSKKRRQTTIPAMMKVKVEVPEDENESKLKTNLTVVNLKEENANAYEFKEIQIKTEPKEDVSQDYLHNINSCQNKRMRRRPERFSPDRDTSFLRKKSRSVSKSSDRIKGNDTDENGMIPKEESIKVQKDMVTQQRRSQRVLASHKLKTHNRVTSVSKSEVNTLNVRVKQEPSDNSEEFSKSSIPFCSNLLISESNKKNNKKQHLRGSSTKDGCQTSSTNTKKVKTNVIVKKESDESTLKLSQSMISQPSPKQTLSHHKKGEPSTTLTQFSYIKSRSKRANSEGVNSNSSTGRSSSRATRSNKNVELWSPPKKQRHGSTKPRVLFTGYNDPADHKIVTDLGGRIVDTCNDCTVLVATKIKRTCKLLSAIGMGRPIVSPTWLLMSKSAGNFLDPWEFLLKDHEAEEKYGFSLQDTIKSSSNFLLFEGFSIYATPSVQPPPCQMRDIVECAGGDYLHAPPKKYEAQVCIISCVEDKKLWSLFKSLGIPILGVEFILTGLLRHELLLEDFVLG